MTQNQKRLVLSFVLVFYLSLIWFLSSLPIPVKAVKIPLFDKFAHIVLYAGLGGIIFALTREWNPKENIRVVVLFTVVCGGLYGALDEIHQRFVPGRTCSIFDLLADIIGTFLGAIVIYKTFSKNRKG